jgi:lysophospholipase L1-like esterase
MEKKNNPKKSRIRVFLQNLALIFLSFAIFLIIIEITIRFFEYGNLVVYQPDPKMFWKPVPNQRAYTKFGRKLVTINSKGTRGKDFDKSKPKNVYRIICLGDSRTFGWGLSESETYSGLLNERLQEFVGNKVKIEVINAGVNAWSYAQMYVYLRDIAIHYEPDMVLLADANLWSQFSEESSQDFRKKMLWRVRLKNILRRSAIYHFLIEVKLRKIYEKYRTKFIPIDPKSDSYFLSEQKERPYYYFDEQIDRIINLLMMYKVEALFVHIPEKTSLSLFEKPQILSIKEKISKKYNIKIVDVTKEFREATKYVYLPSDPVHPSAEGSKIIADRLFDHMSKEIEYKKDQSNMGIN